MGALNSAVYWLFGANVCRLNGQPGPTKAFTFWIKGIGPIPPLLTRPSRRGSPECHLRAEATAPSPSHCCTPLVIRSESECCHCGGRGGQQLERPADAHGYRPFTEAPHRQGGRGECPPTQPRCDLSSSRRAAFKDQLPRSPAGRRRTAGDHPHRVRGGSWRTETSLRGLQGACWPVPAVDHRQRHAANGKELRNQQRWRRTKCRAISEAGEIGSADRSRDSPTAGFLVLG